MTSDSSTLNRPGQPRKSFNYWARYQPWRSKGALDGHGRLGVSDCSNIHTVSNMHLNSIEVRGGIETHKRPIFNSTQFGAIPANPDSRNPRTNMVANPRSALPIDDVIHKS